MLPDYSVIGDPLEQSGLIIWRPIAGDQTAVHLDLQRIQSHGPGRAVRDPEQSALS